jgi:L-ascorbate metabolism protein UlaG (beta-lactamase superfamily)
VTRLATRGSYKGFHLTFLRSRHGKPEFFPGKIARPFAAPAPANTWRSDTVYAVLIRHNGRTILFNASASFDPAALADTTLKADVVYFASTGLYRRPSRWVDSYWQTVVRDRGACRAILVHWDNFFRSLDEDLVPMRWPVDSFAKSMRRVLDRAATTGVDVRLPVVGQPTNPFAGLEFTPDGRCRARSGGGG